MGEFLIYDDLYNLLGKVRLVGSPPVGLILAILLLVMATLFAPIYLSYIIFIKRGWGNTDTATKLMWVILLPVVLVYPQIVGGIGKQINLLSIGEIIGFFFAGGCLCLISVILPLGFWVLVYKVIKNNL